ncbi:MAG: sugar ABC transporter ATP-binding protein [Actinobacteria bacterium]|nr:sugar ABC transporter ATP-binding protein [Actinomycetota bacterium]
MRQLRDEGVAVVFISHRMREMLDISDRYTVLREGQFIDTAPASDVDANWLLDRMVLQRAGKHTTVKSAATTKPIVRVDDLKDKFGAVNGVSLEFFPGQITGMAGLAGAGRTELVETIVGFRPRHSGQVFVNDQWVAPTPKAMMHAGVALVPDDRRAKSNFLEMSVRENLTIAMHNVALAKRSKSKESKIVKEWVEKLRIRTQDIDTPIKNLSGGNQQKVIIARCLQINPKFLILDEPTRGIDLGAKAEIYELLRNLANDGLSILAVSSELVEIFEISQRVLVMHAGVITADLTREEATEQRVVAAATGEGNG